MLFKTQNFKGESRSDSIMCNTLIKYSVSVSTRMLKSTHTRLLKNGVGAYLVKIKSSFLRYLKWKQSFACVCVCVCLVWCQELWRRRFTSWPSSTSSRTMTLRKKLHTLPKLWNTGWVAKTHRNNPSDCGGGRLEGRIRLQPKQSRCLFIWRDILSFWISVLFWLLRDSVHSV